MEKHKEITFNLQVTMKTRWVPHFLAMLQTMQRYGEMGCSRQVGIYSDGDGDFRPKFEWDSTLPSIAEPIVDESGNMLYDAG